MVIGNPPGSGIEVQVLVETAGLLEAAELDKAVAAAQGPAAPARAVVVFEHLHLVADLVQLERRDQAGNSRSEDQHGGAFRVALEPDRPLVGRFGREPQGGHGLIHRRASGGGADHGEETPAARRRLALFGHGAPPLRLFPGFELPHRSPWHDRRKSDASHRSLGLAGSKFRGYRAAQQSYTSAPREVVEGEKLTLTPGPASLESRPAYGHAEGYRGQHHRSAR